ncbi:aminoglycoside N3'-acetyltransferase [soil metagenome]
MSRLKQVILTFAPEFILRILRNLKKKIRRKELLQRAVSKEFIPENQLLNNLKAIGLKEGDSVLVHSSMSKIGLLEKGPETLIDSLLAIIGKEGTLLMPAFPAKGRNKDYLIANASFDILKTPSNMGVVTECFRTLPGVKRSFHPTDSVCALGPLADYYTNSHFGELTPYSKNSPFRKLCTKNGKILMLGTTLNGACTNLHTLEDAVDFKYPVYDNTLFTVEMMNEQGEKSIMKTKVHNPVYSAKRNCDALKPLFEKEGVLINGKIGEAESMLIDANAMLDCMIRNYNVYGVTMYTPYGEKGELK